MISIQKGLQLPLLFCGCATLYGSGTDSSASDATPGEWEMLLTESEEFLAWSEDPLADLYLPPEPLTLWTVSVRAGVGSSSNFLKRPSAVSSPFSQIEGDLYILREFSRSSFTALGFVEAFEYFKADSVKREGIAFLHASQTFERGAWVLGLEAETFYGRQIFDASLLDSSPPEGDLFKQLRPRLSGRIAFEANDRSRFESSLGIERVDYEEASGDYWRPGFTAAWLTTWQPAMTSRLQMDLYGEWYDEELPRTESGLPLAGEDPLTVYGIRMEGGLEWKPAFLDRSRLHIKTGFSREEAATGSYEDLWRYWAALSVREDFPWAQIRLSGRWQETLYDVRQAGFRDRQALKQRYRTLNLEVKRDLRRNVSIQLGIEWNAFMSLAEGESFSERRVQALLEWTY